MACSESEKDVSELHRVVERLHSCKADLSAVLHVTDSFHGRTAWQDDIHVFALQQHPDTDTCYAWSAALEGSDKCSFYAVLKQPPFDSLQAAVHAAIVADYKAGRSP